MPKGELVRNPSFEVWLGTPAAPQFWTTLNVTQSTNAKLGSFAALLTPTTTTSASVQQAVPVAPNHFYRLQFSAARSLTQNSSILIEVFWIGNDGISIIGTGLSLSIQPNTLGDVSGEYQTFYAMTTKSPLNAHHALIRIAVGPSSVVTDGVLVDDVSFVEQSPL